MEFSIYDGIGMIGVIIGVIMHFLMQMKKIGSHNLVYILSNIFASFLILISLSHDFNLSATVTEVFWVIGSLMGLWQWFSARRQS